MNVPLIKPENLYLVTDIPGYTPKYQPAYMHDELCKTGDTSFSKWTDG
ncbi:MAG: hypothetical protein IPG09_04680 [Ignavibacteria bacterium]|nr:hypothetical protein [Ignavibacteria bacterium]